eukprot:CAMPEP_0178396624 /NCGR_PEP_ID=MMETSP0689_2-20121128/13823_1 /TAXON_ID=160604 /ORGANISM="Amphidinium massartii, Strain CS-259" /LENGTH=698 /DNA_ID=CAMNT_0020017301 /DNA_START=32 /DNA_END=2126 /DNA_ORIENTATION=+
MTGQGWWQYQCWMLLRVAALLLCCAMAEQTYEPGGEAACPCVDAFSDPVTRRDIERSSNASGSNASAVCLESLNGNCYPQDYGSRCHEWDLEHSPCNVEDPALWCLKPWCYVDSSNCQRPLTKSQLWNTSSSVYYSYATCGSLDEYTEISHTSALAMRTLGSPTPALRPVYTIVNIDNHWQGAFVDFTQEIWDTLRVTPQVVQVSDASLSRFSSKFSACVHEVALNRTDLCIGNFWDTPQRLLMASFTGHIYQDAFYLISFRDDEQTLADILAAPFRPLHWFVWLLCGVFLGIFALGFCLFEETRCMPLKEMRRKTTPKNVHAKADRFGTHFYETILSFFSSSSSLEVPLKTHSAKILNVSFAMFILLIITSYTANLTTLLVVDRQKAKIDSLEAGIQAGMRICAPDVISRMLQSRERRITPVLNDTLSRTADILAAMDDGACELAVIDQDGFEAAQRGVYTNDDRHCNKVLVGQPLASIGNAMPVSPEFHQAFSWITNEKLIQGRYQELSSRHKADMLPPFRCEKEEEETESLTIDDLAGIFWVTGLLVAISSFFWCCGRGSKHTAGKVHSHLATNEVLHVGVGGKSVSVRMNTLHNLARRSSMTADEDTLSPLPGHDSEKQHESHKLLVQPSFDHNNIITSHDDLGGIVDGGHNGHQQGENANGVVNGGHRPQGVGNGNSGFTTLQEDMQLHTGTV